MVVGVVLVIISPIVWIAWAITSRYPGVVGWMLSCELVLVVGLLVSGAVYGVVRLVAPAQGIDASVPRQVWLGLLLFAALYTLVVGGGGVIYHIWGAVAANGVFTMVLSVTILVDTWRRRQHAKR